MPASDRLCRRIYGYGPSPRPFWSVAAAIATCNFGPFRQTLYFITQMNI